MRKREKSFFECRGYASYLASLLLGGGFLRLYRRVWRFLRPTLWLRRILRLLVWLVLLLESGALLLLLSLALLLLAPLAAASFLVLLPLMLHVRARTANRLLPQLRGERLVLLCAESGDGLARRLSEDGYLVLFIRTPSFPRRRSHSPSGGRLALSPWLWFSLRRQILSCPCRVICLDFFENDLAKK